MRCVYFVFIVCLLSFSALAGFDGGGGGLLQRFYGIKKNDQLPSGVDWYFGKDSSTLHIQLKEPMIKNLKVDSFDTIIWEDLFQLHTPQIIGIPIKVKSGDTFNPVIFIMYRYHEIKDNVLILKFEDLLGFEYELGTGKTESFDVQKFLEDAVTQKGRPFLLYVDFMNVL